jgi:hypothetical protein
VGEIQMTMLRTVWIDKFLWRKAIFIKTGGKTLKKTRMHYDQMQEQWYVDLAGRKYGLHCGESFELYIGRKAIPCQLELSNKWYVIMGDTRLDLRENDQYKVNI